MRIFDLKHQFCGIAAALCLAVGCISGMSVTAEEQLPFGDCDMNGIVNAEDAQLLCAYLTGAEDMVLSKYADFNQDGVLNVVDLTLMKHKILNPDQPQTATMLVYQCGSDLESTGKEATTDMEEMIRATRSENLNIVLETGGAKRWYNDYVGTDANYRVSITKAGISSEKISEQPKSMGESSTLLDFIQASVAAYPADRYALVIWDHGVGPIFGCCYDELSEDLLTVPELCTALDKCGVHFDWIGFDCCLMGSAEVTYAVRNYADYMVASEESENSYGWYYKNFLTSWGRDIAMPSEKIVTQIVDDTIKYSEKMLREDEGIILTAYDLSQAAEMMKATAQYMYDVSAIAKEDGIQTVMDARKSARDFGDEEYDLVDLYDMTQNLPTAHSPAVGTAMKHLIVHTVSRNLPNASGLSVWFFENYPSDYVYLDQTFLKIGIDYSYVNTMKTLAKSYINSLGATVQNTKSRTEPWFRLMRYEN